MNVLESLKEYKELIETMKELHFSSIVSEEEYENIQTVVGSRLGILDKEDEEIAVICKERMKDINNDSKWCSIEDLEKVMDNDKPKHKVKIHVDALEGLKD
jgi:hypothetical protein